MDTVGYERVRVSYPNNPFYDLLKSNREENELASVDGFDWF